MKTVMDESLAPLMEILTAIMDLVGGPKEETPEVDVEADKVAQPVAAKVVEDMAGGSVDSTETGGTEEAVQEDIETLPRISFYRNVETGAVRAVGVGESGAIVASSDDIPEETLLADRTPENYELVNDGDLGEGWEEAGESLAAKGCDEDDKEEDEEKDIGKSKDMTDALISYMAYIDEGLSEDDALEQAALDWEVEEADLLDFIMIQGD